MVTLLSGQPKEGVSIEARSESKGYYEETVTDSSGSYRLRGLLPDTSYSIKVVQKDGLGSAKIERASPESVPVTVSSICWNMFFPFLGFLNCVLALFRPYCPYFVRSFVVYQYLSLTSMQFAVYVDSKVV